MEIEEGSNPLTLEAIKQAIVRPLHLCPQNPVTF